MRDTPFMKFWAAINEALTREGIPAAGYDRVRVQWNASLADARADARYHMRGIGMRDGATPMLTVAK